MHVLSCAFYPLVCLCYWSVFVGREYSTAPTESLLKYSTMQYRSTQSYYTDGAGCIMYNTYYDGRSARRPAPGPTCTCTCWRKTSGRRAQKRGGPPAVDSYEESPTVMSESNTRVKSVKNQMRKHALPLFLSTRSLSDHTATSGPVSICSVHVDLMRRRASPSSSKYDAGSSAYLEDARACR